MDHAQHLMLLQATTSVFFVAIAYNDALCGLALFQLYYLLIILGCMFLHLANFKGRQVSQP